MTNLFRGALVALLVIISAFAQDTGWRQTPFGPAWLGPGPMPSLPTAFVPPAAVPALPPFVPTYMKGVTVKTLLGTFDVNEWYFADAPTALEICRRLACAFVFLQAAGGSGGPNSYSESERWLAFRDGTPSQNAGLIASYFTRNPEDKFPGVALSLLSTVLAPQRPKLVSFTSSTGEPNR